MNGEHTDTLSDRKFNLLDASFLWLVEVQQVMRELHP